MSCSLSLSNSDFREPLLSRSLHEEEENDDDEEEEEIILLEINEHEHDEADSESVVLMSALYFLFFLQYYFLFQYDYDTGLEFMAVYGTILLFAMASYLYNGVISSTAAACTAFGSSKALQFVPEMIIVSSMALTFALESAIPGFLWLVAGTCGLSTVVVVFHALQLLCRRSETAIGKTLVDGGDIDEEESIV